MRIDAHTHQMHAGHDAEGHLRPPLMTSWKPEHGAPDTLIQKAREQGIEKILVLDPAPVVFETQKIFGDFVTPIPMVFPDKTAPKEIDRLLSAGGRGIKFIAPAHSYGDNRYFPLYEAVRDHKALAVFHTGYLTNSGVTEPGGILGVDDFVDITNMRPMAIDRVARAFPDLKMLMAHFGNPWWEECWTVLKSHKNVYAEFSGGTACTKSMAMWREMFAPNGQLHVASVSKLCFATDITYFLPEGSEYLKYADFYERFYEAVGVPGELRERIDRENALALIGP